MQQFWAVPREWAGEVVFIVAGGVSVETQSLELLQGRKVIAVNSSYRRVPFADYLFFGDARWLREEQRDKRFAPQLEAFRGRKVGGIEVGAPYPQPFLTLRKWPGKSRDVSALSPNPGEVAYRWTSLTAAINLAVHLGAAKAILLGADCKPAPDGRIWHHEPHRWPVKRERWPRHKNELAAIVGHLAALGMGCLNASPGSALEGLWPVMTLEQAISRVDGQRLAA